MKIIIAGAGEVGVHLAKMLSKENHNITVVDNNAEKLILLENHTDVLGLDGNAVSPSVLKDAGVSDADLFIAVTQNEETNITSSLLAKKIGAKRTIARIDDKEYLYPVNNDIFKEVGVDSLIYPQKLASEEIIELLKQTGISEKIDFYKDQLSLYVIKLEDNAPILNKSLIEVAQMSSNLDYRAVAIYRNNKTIIPKGNDVFKLNDLIYTISTKTGVKSLLEITGRKNIHIKNIMILGGSRIGKRLAKELQKHHTIKLIEKDSAKCERLANELDNTLILNGDGSDTELLLEEGIKKMDAFIAVTENSETNILSCLLAKRFGVKKTIAEIENIDFIDLAEDIGIDTIVNKKLIAASHIFSYTLNAEVTSFKMLTGTDAEVIEIIAHNDSKIIGKPLAEIKFPKNAIIGGIIRNDESIIAQGNTIINTNDKVVVFSLPIAIKEIEKFFN